MDANTSKFLDGINTYLKINTVFTAMFLYRYLHSVLSMVFGLIISIPPITITNTHPCNRFSIAIISPLIIAITITSLRKNLKIIFVKPHLHGRLFCNAIRRFFMRENLSRKAVTHTRQDSLAAIAFGKNRCRVSNTCDLRCRLYFCATRCNNRSRP